MQFPYLSQSLARSSAPLFRRVAAIVPPWASVFLIVMAILINSPALFYMATAMVATILACRVQSFLAVRGLRIERVSPPAVHVGEQVTVHLTVWSEKRIKRPLITVQDAIPERLRVANLTPSLPIAPSFDQPIQTRYSFRPLRRGIYRWSVVHVIGTDALGLVTTTRQYRTTQTELIVYPAKIPVSVALRPSGGAGGVSESETGKFRGSGLEPRSVREYVEGDPLRYVHWASSARRSQLMVKEFEIGSQLAAQFWIQRNKGSDYGAGFSTLEAMCGHAVYLCEKFLKMGASISFPTLENHSESYHTYEERAQQIAHLMAMVEADRPDALSTEILSLGASVHGGTMYLMLAQADPSLPGVLSRIPGVQKVCLVYNPQEYSARTRLDVSAAKPEYLEELRRAGCEIIVMPKVEGAY
ncbi:MAG: DUF58 domain-containing protein [Armatimonadetes bacterium]|nr:DUF58 domain-containing protein [Armatimonadota bacterium]